MQPVPTILKALADPNRLRVVWALTTARELCACQLTELLGVAGATVSRHLATLSQAGLIKSRKDGRWVHFRLDPEFKRAALFRWLDRQSQADPQRDADRQLLAAIVAEDPVDLCRRQRGLTCCPQEAP